MTTEEETASNNLWIGNLPSDILDSELMEILGKYGALGSVTTYSARSYSFLFFRTVEEASAAMHALQAYSIRGKSIKIEFARPAKPCAHLWVGGISPTVSMEQLEEEFLRFGKIVEFRFVREQNTAFIDFVKVEEAIQAKKNLNGKLLSGQEIRVDFLRSQSRREIIRDLRDSGQRPLQLSGGRKELQPSNILWVGYPSSIQIDEQMLHNAMILFGEIERIKSFPSRHYSFVEFRSVDEARRAKEGLQGRLFNDPRISIMYSSSDLAPGKDASIFYPGSKGARPELYNEDVLSNNLSGPLGPNTVRRPNLPLRPGPQGGLDPLLPAPELDRARQSPSGAGLLPTPATRIRTSMVDSGLLQREPKRSRIDSTAFFDDDRGLGFERGYGLGSPADGVGRGPFANRLSPAGVRVAPGGPFPGRPDNDIIWRGIIAKGGTPVCHARCVPMRRSTDWELPEVVNCSARTGLDMLTKHYAEAIGFDVVYFLPDSEDDFASYTEFLLYLGSKDRAGVAKFDDGTTFFLVPPSDFLKSVLEISGPERLYGVVLKLRQQAPSSASMQPQLHHQPSHLPPLVGGPPLPPLDFDYNLSARRKENVTAMDHRRVLLEESHLPQRPLYPPKTESTAVPLVSQDQAAINPVVSSKGGISLTPELIATLTKILPTSMQSSAPESSPQALGSSAVEPGNQFSGNTSQVQMGNQFQVQGQIQSQFHPYATAPNTLGHAVNAVQSSNQIQDSTAHVPYDNVVASRPPTSFVASTQGGQFALPPQLGYQQQAPQTSQALANEVQRMQYHGSQVGPPNPMQQVQANLPGAGQVTSESESDKTQRYQSTLQFAANLLLQIQQRQQTEQGPGNRQ